MSIIISCFPGIGVEELSQLHSDITNLKASNYTLMADLSENPDFPNNYVDAIENLAEQDDSLILISSYQSVMKQLKEDGIDFIYAIPNILDLQEYLKRYRECDNFDVLADYMEDNWFDILENSEYYTDDILVLEHGKSLLDYISVDYTSSPKFVIHYPDYSAMWKLEDITLLSTEMFRAELGIYKVINNYNKKIFTVPIEIDFVHGRITLGGMFTASNVDQLRYYLNNLLDISHLPYYIDDKDYLLDNRNDDEEIVHCCLSNLFYFSYNSDTHKLENKEKFYYKIDSYNKTIKTYSFDNKFLGYNAKHMEMSL